MTPVLSCSGVSFAYGSIRALTDVSLHVDAGEAISVIGANGAGKSTLARILGGLARPAEGEVHVHGVAMARGHAAVGLGVASVLEGRRLFSDQTVETNLQLGAYSARLDTARLRERMARVYDLFPRLHERRTQSAASLSGGEQQMVAIGRALMSQPRVIVLDEPSMGLAPIMAQQVFSALADLRREGLAIVLVEQNARLAFQLTSRVYLLQQGLVVQHGEVAELRDTDLVRQTYLGTS